MADKIQIYGGEKENMPQLMLRELGFCYDTNELYIGTANGENKLIGSVVWGTKINELNTDVEGLKTEATNLNTQITALKAETAGLQTKVDDLQREKLSASAASSVTALPAEAVMADIAAAFNDLVAKLKASGLMEQ